MKNDCGGPSPLSDIQLPFYSDVLRYTRLPPFPLGSTWDLLCTSHAAKTSIGLRLWDFAATCVYGKDKSQQLPWIHVLVLHEACCPRRPRRKDFGTKGHGSSVAFRPSANLPRSFRELSAPESNFQVTYSIFSQYHYSYNAPSTALIRWSHRGEESDQYSGRVSILGLRRLPLLQCPNPSVNPKCA